MAKEFAEFILELNKKPLKEQVEELKKVVSGLVNLLERFVKKYTMEFSAIQTKMIKLETKQIRSKIPKIKVLVTQPPPPPPQTRPIGNENVRIDVLGELKELFEKRK